MKSVLIFLALSVAYLVGCKRTSPSGESPRDESTQSGDTISEVVSYYDNGVISKQGKALGSKRIGNWKSYYPNGYLWSEVTYKEGYRQGPTSTYYSSGVMRYEGAYHNDERSGTWIFYDTLGVTVQTVDMDVQNHIADSLLSNSAAQ